MRRLFFSIIFISFASCSEETLPRPKAFLNLEYDTTIYQELPLLRPYTFEVSETSVVKDAPKNWLKIEYPKLKASLDITYRKIDGNLRELLIESEKLVFKHTSKAAKISSNDYVNDQQKVFGTLHDITGNAASQIQFHITDSTDHFIKGALYFNVKPNYDSLLPAVHHIKKDILHLMETLKWKK
jgi:gliding motility-associated lipoprotein GldD|tara:strand:+ start:152 stop:703 length:552 start_codon:yes stop_codon:yes gene_type:complete